MRFSKLFIASAMTASLMLTGCETTQTANAATSSEAVASKAVNLFEVHHDGRIHQFYDMDTYKSYLSVGETAFRLTRIGAGPKGETLVFGLPKADKKKGADTTAAKIWDGKMTVEGEFYGEMMKHGRIYVFDSLADMKHVRELGHPNFMYTEIGAGPKGETLVFVLNKKNKKKKPVAQIAKYKAMHAMK